MSFSPFSRTSLSSLISLLNRERTHAPISPARGRPLIVAISSFSLSVPCCNPRKPGKELRRVPIFPDEIEAGCRHTHLRRLSREFPAKPRRVGRRARYQSLRLVDFRRPPRLSRQFPVKPRRVRRRVSGVSVFASCVTFRRRSTDLDSRRTIPASRHFRFGIFESSRFAGATTKVVGTTGRIGQSRGRWKWRWR
ncbi:uncharacterized protein LOC126634176 isoform X2 [Malus sylvestris]|uniref:uncharacterized protein LOC126634176 isoform X2 n=1 Tax=Malus sylvestris TaxID=3752 RepID=UPI0021ACC1B1|nr:uncharacterized protein LOC126634176 isoform X2 [Malus sylvestris]